VLCNHNMRHCVGGYPQPSGLRPSRWAHRRRREYRGCHLARPTHTQQIIGIAGSVTERYRLCTWPITKSYRCSRVDAWRTGIASCHAPQCSSCAKCASPQASCCSVWAMQPHIPSHALVPKRPEVSGESRLAATHREDERPFGARGVRVLRLDFLKQPLLGDAASLLDPGQLQTAWTLRADVAAMWLVQVQMLQRRIQRSNANENLEGRGSLRYPKALGTIESRRCRYSASIHTPSR
jgi:hypothetical protein